MSVLFFTRRNVKHTFRYMSTEPCGFVRATASSGRITEECRIM